MGNRRPKSEQLDSLQSREAGLSITELLVVLAISSIVLFTVTLIATMSLRSATEVNASMSIDEETTRLHTSLRSIVCRQWTFLQSVSMSEDVENQNGEDQEVLPTQSITLINNIPYAEEPWWTTTVSTVTYNSQNRQIVHEFLNHAGTLVSNVLVSNVDAFTVSLEEEYLQYSATLSYPSPNFPDKPIVERIIEGAVRFY